MVAGNISGPGDLIRAWFNFCNLTENVIYGRLPLPHIQEEGREGSAPPPSFFPPLPPRLPPCYLSKRKERKGGISPPFPSYKRKDGKGEASFPFLPPLCNSSKIKERKGGTPPFHSNKKKCREWRSWGDCEGLPGWREHLPHLGPTYIGPPCGPLRSGRPHTI